MCSFHFYTVSWYNEFLFFLSCAIFGMCPCIRYLKHLGWWSALSKKHTWQWLHPSTMVHCLTSSIAVAVGSSIFMLLSLLAIVLLRNILQCGMTLVISSCSMESSISIRRMDVVLCRILTTASLLTTASSFLAKLSIFAASLWAQTASLPFLWNQVLEISTCRSIMFICVLACSIMDMYVAFSHFLPSTTVLFLG